MTAFIQKTLPNRQKLFFATLCRSSKALLWTGLLFCIHCSNEVEKETNVPKPPAISTTESPDLAKAIEKRIEGNSAEAIRLLRQLNQTYPNTPEVLLQLARALFESKQFELAAFRFDQVNSIKSSSSVYRESGLAYEYADDFQSAISRYSSYLSDNSGDEEIWLRIARLYALNGEETKALNAFSKGSEKSTYDDCIMMADLFYSKKLTQQAEFWYQEASRKIEGVQPEPLLGLLRIRLMEKENQKAESLILAIEKSHPGTIEETDLDKEAAQILKQRRLADFISRGVRTEGLNITELAAFLLTPVATVNEPVIALSKIPPSALLNNSDEIIENDQVTSLASAFANQQNVNTQVLDNLGLARQSFLNRQYNETIQFARSAIKNDPKDAQAWRLCSQAHYQLGETKEAEMTILEALRHDQENIDIRMDYLRVARETLDPKRYLEELENAREQFPNTIDLVWELARRYHLIERMPVTAGILYRQVMDLTSESSAIHKRAKLELLKLGEP